MSQISKLKLQQNNGNWINISSTSLTFSNASETLIECRIELHIDTTQYQSIEQDQSFNLTSEIKGPHTGKDFEDNRAIYLQLLLKPDLLPLLLAHAQTAEAASAYLAELSHQQTTSQVDKSPEPISPLLQTESWLCLAVKQQQDSGEVGFNTFWHSVNPALINNPDTTSDQLAEGIVNFVKEWTEANLAEATQTATTQFLKGISDTFGELLNGAIEELDTDNDPEDPSLFQAVIAFFEAEQWPFIQIPDTPALRLSFRGDSGQWNCYAKANQAQQTLLFYSICPIPAPEIRLPAAAEFITRANYGLIIGNFELDYGDGEIRYKTSIDIEGDTLSPALIKQLVYANVLTVDQYLPGLFAVLEQGISPLTAIAQVEQEQP